MEFLVSASTLGALLAGAGVFFATWLLSLPLRDVSLVDRVWGLSFIALVGGKLAVLAASGRQLEARSFLILGLVSVWGLRLSWYLHGRNQGRGEDYRYRAMRRRLPGFAFSSLLVVFGLQWLIACVVASPLLWAIHYGEVVPSWSWLDLVGVMLWAVGLGFEVLADRQLSRFKAGQPPAGSLLTTGVWSLCRHPNYFGEALLWWGVFLVCLSVPGAWMLVFGPLLMSFLLLRVSGVSLLEKKLRVSKPEYAHYMQTTPAFLPDLKKLWLGLSSKA